MMCGTNITTNKSNAFKYTSYICFYFWLAFAACAGCNKCQLLALPPPQCVSCPAGARPAGPDWLPVGSRSILFSVQMSFSFQKACFILGWNQLVRGLTSSHPTQTVTGLYDHEQKLHLRCLVRVSLGLDSFPCAASGLRMQDSVM